MHSRVFLARIVSDKKESIKILLDHPETKDRIAAINALATAGVTTPMLDAAEWTALKKMCGPLSSSGGTAQGEARKTDPR